MRSEAAPTADLPGRTTAVTFFKAAAAPVVVSAAMVAVQLLWISVPLAWRGPVYSGLWFVFMAVGVLGPLVTAVGGWLFLRRRLEPRTALALMVPYVVVVVAGLMAVWFAAMAITGDGP